MCVQLVMLWRPNNQGNVLSSSCRPTEDRTAQSCWRRRGTARSLKSVQDSGKNDFSDAIMLVSDRGLAFLVFLTAWIDRVAVGWDGLKDLLAQLFLLPRPYPTYYYIDGHTINLLYCRPKNVKSRIKLQKSNAKMFIIIFSCYHYFGCIWRHNIHLHLNNEGLWAN